MAKVEPITFPKLDSPTLEVQAVSPQRAVHNADNARASKLNGANQPAIPQQMSNRLQSPEHAPDRTSDAKVDSGPKLYHPRKAEGLTPVELGQFVDIKV